METFGERLRQARKERGLTQAQAAKKSGISQPNLSELERGEYQTSGYAAALAAAYGVNALWLAEGRGPKYPSAAEGAQPIGPSPEDVAESVLSVLRALSQTLSILPQDSKQRFVDDVARLVGLSKSGDQDWETPEWMRGPVPPSEGYQEAVLIEDDGKPLIRTMDDAEAASERERKARGSKKSA